jgi:predicted metalloprotease
MRIGDERESDNLEDMRGASGGFGGFGGGRNLSIGGIVIALVASYIFGVDPRYFLGMMEAPPQAQAPVTSSGPRKAPTDEKAIFVSRVLATTEDTWSAIFSEGGRRYTPPRLVLFTGSFPTACGMGQAAAGPFYCPGDAKVYIDLRFYELMRQRFHAGGDFAQAYVIAHEVGHHVQNLLGLTAKMDQQRGRVSQQQYNALSVRLELQADCFAGVWANRANRAKAILEPGDVEEAIRAATAIGDDTLQKQAQGHVVPDSFTHGSSAQRVRWLRQGLESGDVNACDTFRARQL